MGDRKKGALGEIIINAIIVGFILSVDILTLRNTVLHGFDEEE